MTCWGHANALAECQSASVQAIQDYVMMRAANLYAWPAAADILHSAKVNMQHLSPPPWYQIDTDQKKSGTIYECMTPLVMT